MERTILKDIKEQAKEQADEYQLYHNHLVLAHRRNKRRITNPPIKDVKVPFEWSIDKKFNPFYVLKRKKQIAKSISRKILNGTYAPSSPYNKEIPKKGGGIRKICVYQIPDSAVSDRFYYNLLSKNKHRFSSLTYAYRNDRNIHFAIQDIANELITTPRIFVAEFDFSDFFGSIKHSYVLDQLRENAFLISKTEMSVINAFLAPFNGKGIPLGTSISLFLANVACWRLDRSLENEGIRFARYADDTIIWSKEYSKISKAYELINLFSSETGIKINYQKSDGISLLQKKNMPAEFINTKEYIEFLGYKVSTEFIGIKDNSVKKIKKQISYLLYRNLIQPLKTTPFKGVNIPEYDLDKDFLTSIMQIRRYLYGNLTEITLRKYLNGTYKVLSFKGIMSFYPLVNDECQMRELDKWLVSTIMNSLNLRKKLFKNHGTTFQENQFPFNADKDVLLERCKNSSLYGNKGLFEIPSFFRIFQALQIGLKNEGIEKVMNPLSNYYYE